MAGLSQFRRPAITPFGWLTFGCVVFWVAVCGALWVLIKAVAR